MAYNVYVCCNRCGADCACFTNESVSVTKFEKFARRRGWHAKNPEWYCPECKKLVKNETEEEQP